MEVFVMADDVIRDVPTRFPTMGARLGERFVLSRVSWGAIWAGTMVTLGLVALFLTFGIFINALIGGSTVWSAIWYLVTMGASFYAGAWCAARMCDSPGAGRMHGITTWGLGTLATVILFGALDLLILSIIRASGGFLTLNLPGVWAGLIWGGVMLSLICAYIGGGAGVPKAPRATAVEPETGTTPLRRAG
ncbi:MAG TPA: hypothetical protein VKX45_20755 [Bryobacteraceae bacterium]|nr:hypothetical protein [Bryobacteraceae bacterium]